MSVLINLLFPFFLVYLKLSGGIWKRKGVLQLAKKQNRLLVGLYDQYFAKYGAFVGLASQFDGEPCFPHGPYGVFISSGAIIGKNVVVFQHVTIGSDSLVDSVDQGSPTVGDRCYFGAGAKVIGKVSIGRNCRVGANAVVYRDLEDNSVAVQSSTRVIKKSALDNRFITYRSGKKVYFDNGSWKPAK